MREDIPYFNNSNVITVTLNGVNYEFELKTGQNFYYIVSQNISGERYVVTNE